MTKEMKNIPTIRFKNFTDAWEQRKLKDVFTSLQNNTLSRSDLNGECGIALNIHYGDILTKYGEFIDISNENIPYITNEKNVDKFNNSHLKNGDIIIADTAEDETVGKCTEINGITNQIVISGLHTIPLRPKIKFAKGYLGIYFNSYAYHNQLRPLMHGIKVTSISKSSIQDTNIVYPFYLDEQKKIGQYFLHIDNLITLHQRKLDHLNKLKTYFLQNLFPAKGEKVPKVRFKEFTGDWEQRKLRDIAERVVEKNVALTEHETFTNSAEFGIISQTNFFDHGITNEENIGNYYIVHSDDFVYNPRISVKAPVGPINRNKLGRSGVMSPLYIIFRSHDIDTNYLEYYFKTNYWHSFMHFNGDTGARSDRFNIKIELFYEMPIPTPEVDEQRKIGNLLEIITDIITLHQHQLDQLQSFKKFMLQNMFV